ncbi:peptidase inhibitor family I36 protein [Streptomyces sp. CA-250714]|uniref:peptidase inhibitor family I36 protein n=1 Tax=Streptomyces sp. CA-250714 TaxID=3240060 RepID=UPI003D910714
MKRTITLAVGALSLAATSLIGFSSPAQADATGQKCASDVSLCLFEHDNYKGKVRSSFADDLCQNVPSYMNNKASSMTSGSNYWVRLYDKANCSGASGYYAAPKSKDKDLTNNGFDNKASSFKASI